MGQWMGILVMWDGRLWSGEISSLGANFITCKLSGINQDLIWFLTGIYVPNSREQREEVQWEVGSARGLFDGPWVVCGDFNTARFPSEKKNCSRIFRAMTDLSDFIEDMDYWVPTQYGASIHGGKGTAMTQHPDQIDFSCLMNGMKYSETSNRHYCTRLPLTIIL